MDKEEKLTKKTKKRSASYPAFSLEEVITATKNLKDQLGDGPYSRDSMAVALGYKGVTGSSSMKIASCVHFGLLDRSGNTYSQSELANRIFNYIDEEERNNSLFEAFGKPALYQKLITQYAGKSLPLMLESILIRNYGIQENAAKNAVATFKQSAEYVGALKNGVLSTGYTPDEAQREAEGLHLQTEQKSQSLPASQTATPLSAQLQGYLSVNLPSGLVVSYSQDIAPAFAFGAFGNELKALDDAVAGYIRDTAKYQSEPHQEDIDM